MASLPAFSQTLAEHGLALIRGETTTLQVNVGLLCNQLCRHCHLDAGPERLEIMDRQTMEAVIAYASRVKFNTIDITGGAPELIPDLPFLLKHLAPLTPKIILRSNLTALHASQESGLLDLCRELKIAITASFPSTDQGQTKAMRGQGVFATSIAMLQKLNASGYGTADNGRELNLVANPAGAFLPASQGQAERQFKSTLLAKYGISFNHLYTFANVPLGRYRQWLIDSGNYSVYMKRLYDSFNPGTIPGLMCRSLISIAADGKVYDCDFNLAAGLPACGQKNIREFQGLPLAGTAIATAEHCYACTAGSGFT